MTSQKAQVLALLPKFTGALSLFGSGFIIWDIFRNKQTRRLLNCSDSQDRTFRRIMLGLSCMDLCCSVCNVLSTWPTPSDQSHKIWLASGTTQTCTAQGFFKELGNVGAVLYSASLSIYYVYKISGGSRKRLPRWKQWLLHAVPMGVALAMAVVGLPLTLYNNSGFLCWYAPYPAGCDKTNSCTRGDMAGTFRWIHYGIVWISILTVTVCMGLIFRSVRDVEKQAKRWRFQHSIRFFGTTDTPPHQPPTTEPEEPRHCPESEANLSQSSGMLSLSSLSDSRSITFALDTNFTTTLSLATERKSSMKSNSSAATRTRWVATQAFLYIGGLYLTWIFTTLLRIFQAVQGVSHYKLLVLMALFFPLQGFFNAIIYFRSQYKGASKQNNRRKSTISSLSTNRVLNSLQLSSTGKTFNKKESHQEEPRSLEEMQPNPALGVVEDPGSASNRSSPTPENDIEGDIICCIEETQDNIYRDQEALEEDQVVQKDQNLHEDHA